MVNFFKNLKAWFISHKPTKRRLIQVYAALLYNCNIKGYVTGQIYTGGSKNMCLPGLNCYSCPGAVGACPLGALQNALSASQKRFPYYVLGILLLYGLLLGRTICGFLCPFGLIQEWLFKIKTPKLKKNSVTRVLSYFKYVLLAVLVLAVPLIYSLLNYPVPAFCKYICPDGTLLGAIGLLINPNNADQFAQLGPLFTWKFVLLVIFVVASIFAYRFFCRFFCPLGAIYGFFNRFALLGVTIDRDKCTDCGLCVTTCQMDVKHVGDHECINCGACMRVCHTNAIRWKGSKIFLHGNKAETPVQTEKAPLSQLNGNIGDNCTAISAAPSGRKTINKHGGAMPANVKVAKRNRVLEIVAWTLALVILGGAIVYYNFVDTQSARRELKVGDICPDFSIATFVGDDLVISETLNFTLSEQKGKVTVLNFWATWCTPCVNEIPHFEELYKKYSDKLNVIAIHQAPSLTGYTPETVAKFINDRTIWNGYTLTFAVDNLKDGNSDTYVTLGGQQTWPMTIIVDQEGKIAAIRQGSVTYEQLESMVLPYLQ